MKFGFPKLFDDMGALLLEDYDTNVEIIPGGCTSVLQPLDIGINKPLKSRVRRHGIINFKVETKSGYLKGAEREDIVKWSCEAWRDISY